MTRRYPEASLHISIITWVRLMQKKYPALSSIFHPANGFHLDKSQAAKSKAMGVVAGVWDLCFCCPADGGMPVWIEVKVKPNGLTPTQKDWQTLLEPHGHRFHVVYDLDEAIDVLSLYAGVPKTSV